MAGLEELSPEHTTTPANLDVVLVHGLDGHRRKTWTAADGTFWPTQLLPQYMSGVRILTYGYDATIHGTTSVARIRDNAMRLLGELRDQREDEAEYRSIVFVGHSLGGIVIKQALRFARDKPQYKNIADSTCGIIFFGTPHRGLTTASWVDFVSKVATSMKDCGKKELPQNQMLDDIKANSLTLLDISEDFRSICSEFGIVSFWEENKMEWLGDVVVSKDSALLELPHEDDFMMGGNHTEICKFSKDDERFSSVWHAIKRLAEKSTKAATLLKSEKDVLDSICNSNFHYHPMGINRTRGTCEWIRNREEFIDWRNSTSPGSNKLWISGSPGCGKTYLSKYIAELLEKESNKSSLDRKTIIASCFLNARKEDRRDGRAILRSTLHKVLAGNGKGIHRWLINKYAVPVYNERKQFGYGKYGEGIWPIDVLRKIWQETLTEATKYFSVTILIDGFDECDDAEQNAFLDAINKVDMQEDGKSIAETSKSRLKIIIVSRAQSRLFKILDEFPTLIILPKHNELDIATTVEESARTLARKIGYSSALENRVRLRVTEGANGMYLWASLMMVDLLQTLPSEARIKKKLERLPRGILELYDSILGEMSKSAEDEDGKLVKAILTWAIFALKELRSKELGLGLALSELEASGNITRHEETPEERLESNIFADVEGTVTRHCGQLVKFSDGKFDLVHRSLEQFLTAPHDTETLREYDPPGTEPLHLPNHKHFYLPPAKSHRTLAKYCIAYLLLSYFSSSGDPFKKQEPGPKLWEQKVRSRIEEHELVAYAALFWDQHINEAKSLRSQKANIRILRDGTSEHAICWTEVRWLLQKGLNEDYPLEKLQNEPSELGKLFGLSKELAQNSEQPTASPRISGNTIYEAIDPLPSHVRNIQRNHTPNSSKRRSDILITKFPQKQFDPGQQQVQGQGRNRKGAGENMFENRSAASQEHEMPQKNPEMSFNVSSTLVGSEILGDEEAHDQKHPDEEVIISENIEFFEQGKTTMNIDIHPLDIIDDGSIENILPESELEIVEFEGFPPEHQTQKPPYQMQTSVDQRSERGSYALHPPSKIKRKMVGKSPEPAVAAFQPHHSMPLSRPLEYQSPKKGIRTEPEIQNYRSQSSIPGHGSAEDKQLPHLLQQPKYPYSSLTQNSGDQPQTQIFQAEPGVQSSHFKSSDAAYQSVWDKQIPGASRQHPFTSALPVPANSRISSPSDGKDFIISTPAQNQLLSYDERSKSQLPSISTSSPYGTHFLPAGIELQNMTKPSASLEEIRRRPVASPPTADQLLNTNVSPEGVVGESRTQNQGTNVLNPGTDQEKETNCCCNCVIQ